MNIQLKTRLIRLIISLNTILLLIGASNTFAASTTADIRVQIRIVNNITVKPDLIDCNQHNTSPNCQIIRNQIMLLRDDNDSQTEAVKMKKSNTVLFY